MTPLPDSLYRLLRQAQFEAHDARRWPTSKEQLRQHVNKLLSEESRQVKAQPRFTESK